MSAESIDHDLKVIRDIVERSHHRIDPHAFHFLHWGAIVLVWYPLHNLFQMQEKLHWMLWLGVGALVLGVSLSAFREALLSRKPRLPGSNTFISKQVSLITSASLFAAVILTILAGILEFIPQENIPIIWGLAYANLAFMVGVVYTRDFLVSGALIFLGAAVAIVVPQYCGFILGPFMGLGMIVPALLAERRVARLREATGEAAE